MTSTTLRLGSQLAMDVYGLVKSGPLNFDGQEIYQAVIATSSDFTARTGIYFSSRRNIVVISQRGTAGTMEDWNVNFDTTVVACSSYITGCLGDVTRGFGDQYMLTASTIYSQLSLKGATVLTNQWIFIVTGHSQGAALATLTAMDLSLRFNIPRERIVLLTFGLPVVGDPSFATQLASRISFYQFILRDQFLIPDVVTTYSATIYGSQGTSLFFFFVSSFTF